MKKEFHIGKNGAKMEEQQIREQIAKDIESLLKLQDGSLLNSIVAQLWINKCAKIAREGHMQPDPIDSWD